MTDESKTNNRRKPDKFLRSIGALDRALEGLNEQDAEEVIERVTSPAIPGIEDAIATCRRVLARFDDDPRRRRRLVAHLTSYLEPEEAS